MLKNERLAIYYRQPETLKKAIFDATVGAFIYRPLLNTPLWTIKYEFLGVIFGRILAESWKKHKYIVSLLLICGEYAVTKDIYYLLISFGVVFFGCLDMLSEKIKYSEKVIVISEVFLGVLAIILFSDYNNFWIRCLFVFTFILVIECNQKIQKIFENKILVNLSKYTYAVYAVHWPIICSFGCYIYLKEKTILIGTIFVTMLLIAVVAVAVECVNGIISSEIRRRM